jgi:hypothetical protein
MSKVCVGGLISISVGNCRSCGSKWRSSVVIRASGLRRSAQVLMPNRRSRDSISAVMGGLPNSCRVVGAEWWVSMRVPPLDVDIENAVDPIASTINGLSV